MRCIRAIRPVHVGLIPGSRMVFSPAPKRHFSLDPSPLISSVTESLQIIHTSTGIPWWALIPLTTVAARLVWTLPLAVLQRKRVQKQNDLRPLVSATGPVLKLNLGKKVQAARAKADAAIANAAKTDPSLEDLAPVHTPLASMKYEEILLVSTKETRKRQKALFKKHGVQLWKNAILPAFQIPLWILLSLCMRNLSGWTSWESLANKPLDPALYTEGLMWFTDLTTLDPLHAFPLALGIVSLCNVEWTFKTFELLAPHKKRRLFRPTITDSAANVSRMSVVFLMAVSLNAPMALVLYWVTSQLFSLVQNIVLDMTMPVSFTPNRRLDYRKLSKGAEDVIRRK